MDSSVPLMHRGPSDLGSTSVFGFSQKNAPSGCIYHRAPFCFRHNCNDRQDLDLYRGVPAESRGNTYFHLPQLDSRTCRIYSLLRNSTEEIPFIHLTRSNTMSSNPRLASFSFYFMDLLIHLFYFIFESVSIPLVHK